MSDREHQALRELLNDEYPSRSMALYRETCFQCLALIYHDEFYSTQQLWRCEERSNKLMDDVYLVSQSTD